MKIDSVNTKISFPVKIEKIPPEGGILIIKVEEKTDEFVKSEEK